MMCDEDAFLRAIIERPDDDLPRLVYADYLDERDDPRGEFIRVECELARIAPDDPRRAALYRRDLELIRMYKDRWAGLLPKLTPHRGVSYWDFRRGLIEVLTIDAPVLVGAAAADVARMPILSLRVQDLTDSLAHQVGGHPALRGVRELDLQSRREGDVRDLRTMRDMPLGRGILRIVDSDRLRRVTSLRIRGELSDDVLTALLRSRRIAQLTNLDLSQNAITDRGADALVRARNLDNIRSISLLTNRFTEQGASALRSRFGGRVRVSVNRELDGGHQSDTGRSR
jgi:uncharacterized protein (TIGR02996 family)